MRLSFLAAVLAILVPTAVLAQNEGTCADPIDLSEAGEATQHVLTLDTRTMTNEQVGQCGDAPPTTGPDIVLDFRGLPTSGLISWQADFDAVVYYRQGTCDSGCADSSTSGTLEFDCNYGLRFEDGDWYIGWDTPFIIVDGANGASGTITLTIEYDTHTPTIEQSWGFIKRRFE